MVDNVIVDCNRSRTVSAEAAGLAGASAALTIVDNDTAKLTFSAAATTISEGNGPLTITVTRNTADTSSPVTVALTNNKPYKMTVPASVTIGAGNASATFEITPVNDTQVEGDRTVDIGGSAGGFAGAGLRLIVTDNDIPTISFDLVQSIVSEAGGIGATRGVLTRSMVTDSPVTVGLLRRRRSHPAAELRGLRAGRGHRRVRHQRHPEHAGPTATMRSRSIPSWSTT